MHCENIVLCSKLTDIAVGFVVLLFMVVWFLLIIIFTCRCNDPVSFGSDVCSTTISNEHYKALKSTPLCIFGRQLRRIDLYSVSMASQLPVREFLCTLKAATRRSLLFKRPCISSAPTRKRQHPRNDRRNAATFTHPHHASAISILSTNVDKSSSEYKNNAKEMDELLARMSELHTRIAEGGPQKAKEKHIARGKMLAREYVRN